MPMGTSDSRYQPHFVSANGIYNFHDTATELNKQIHQHDFSGLQQISKERSNLTCRGNDRCNYQNKHL